MFCSVRDSGSVVLNSVTWMQGAFGEGSQMPS